MDKSREDQLLEAIARLEERLGRIEGAPSGDGAPHVNERLRAKAGELADTVTDYIEAHPVRSTLIAFLLGVVLASRRGGR